MSYNERFFDRERQPLPKKKKENLRKKSLYYPPHQKTQDYDISDLFSDLGNRTIANFFESLQVQAKLNVSQPQDVYEQEADRIAEEIVKNKVNKDKKIKVTRYRKKRDSNKSPVNKAIESKIKNLKGKGKPLNNSIKDLLRNRFGNILNYDKTHKEINPLSELANKANANNKTINDNSEIKIKDLNGKGNSLRESIIEHYESRFDAAFENVRVHTDSNANQLASYIQAKAFTKGNDIVFGEGQYHPETSEGKKLIAHEIAHVVQQEGIQHEVVQRKEINTFDNPIIELAMKHGDEILRNNITCYVNELSGNSSEFKDQIKSLFHLNHKIHMEKLDLMNTLISDIELGKEIAKKYGSEYLADYPELRILILLHNEFGKSTLYWNVSKWGDSNPFDNNDEYTFMLANFFETWIEDSGDKVIKRKKLLKKGFNLKKKTHRYNNPSKFQEKVRENKKNRRDEMYEKRIDRGKERDKGVVYKKDEAVTIVTNGTNDITGRKGETELMYCANIYFVTRSGKMDSYEATNEINEKFGGREGIFIPWNGANTDKDRQDAAKIIIERIKRLQKNNKDVDGNELKLKLNLVGHSHGGNVMIIVANMIYSDPELKGKVEIVNLLSLEAPVREYHLNLNTDDDTTNDINFIHTYSPLDFVQNIGYIDVGGGEYTSLIGMLTIGLPLSIFGLLRLVPEAAHQFEEATKNINVSPYNSPEMRRRYKELLRLIPDAGVLHHQSSRYVDFIDQVIEAVVE